MALQHAGRCVAELDGFRGLDHASGQPLEVSDRLAGECDPLSPRIAGVQQLDPPFCPKRLQAPMICHRRPKLLAPHQLPHGQVDARGRDLRNQGKQPLFERVERGQRRQSSDCFRQVQEAKVDLSLVALLHLGGTSTAGARNWTARTMSQSTLAQIPSSTAAMAMAILVALAYALSVLAFPPTGAEPDGIRWISLPAGVRLVCVLLLMEAGVVVLSLTSMTTCVLYFFPGRPWHALAESLVSVGGCYVVCSLAMARWRFGSSLAGLTPSLLLALGLLCALADAALHSAWQMLVRAPRIGEAAAMMLASDLLGTLTLFYGLRISFRLAAAAGQRPGPGTSA